MAFFLHFSLLDCPKPTLARHWLYSIISAPLTFCGSPFSLINDFIFRKNPFFSKMCVGYAAAVVIAGSEIMFISPSLRSGEIFHYFIYIYIYICTRICAFSPGMALCSLVRVCTIESINSSRVRSRGIDGDFSRRCLNGPVMI